jgi:putative glutamine amidotransferase
VTSPITLAEVLPAAPITASDAPLIAVVVPLNYPDHTDEIRELVVRFTRTALATLTELGARLSIIDPTAATVAGLGDQIDGVVLLGEATWTPRCTDTSRRYPTCTAWTAAPTCADSS